MSRIGRLPIPVPAGVDVTISGREVAVKGPKGSLNHILVEPISITRDEDGTLVVSRPDDERDSKARHGLSRTLVANMIQGVTAGYERTLEIVGVGYRVRRQGQGPRVRARLQPPGPRHRPRRHQLRGRRPRPASWSRASTSSRSVPWRRTSAGSVRRSRTRARACATRVKSCVARSERPVSSYGWKQG